MADESPDRLALRGKLLIGADLTGAHFRDSDLRGVKVADSWLIDVNMSGEVRNFLVNDVDVAPLVEAELDRRHPERVLVRTMATADDHRATWQTIEGLWADTVARARRLPEPLLHEQVDDEYSFTETLRHLIFATDAWAGRSILGDEKPYARLGLTHSSYPPDDARALGIDLGAQPSFDEVLEVRAERLAVVGAIVEGLTDASLEQTSDLPPAPGYPEETRTVRRCLRVVMNEECEHRRYAVRDLTVLESR